MRVSMANHLLENHTVIDVATELTESTLVRNKMRSYKLLEYLLLRIEHNTYYRFSIVMLFLFL